MSSGERVGLLFKATWLCLFWLAPNASMGQVVATLDATLQLRTVDGITVPHQNGIPIPSFEKQE
ncbi:hypothetical protein DCC62_27065, partial [candidate division KSB1 bacterium]